MNYFKLIFGILKFIDWVNINFITLQNEFFAICKNRWTPVLKIFLCNWSTDDMAIFTSDDRYIYIYTKIPTKFFFNLTLIKINSCL